MMETRRGVIFRWAARLLVIRTSKSPTLFSGGGVFPWFEVPDGIKSLVKRCQTKNEMNILSILSNWNRIETESKPDCRRLVDG